MTEGTVELFNDSRLWFIEQDNGKGAFVNDSAIKEKV
jgi:cold shock CspA family protein